MNSIFETKEQYLAFRAKWKSLYTEGYHKPIRVETNPGFVMVSRLDAWYHLAYNIAVGRDPYRAFARYRKADHYAKPILYQKLNYGRYNVKHDFSLFGDTLTAEQKVEISKRMEAFIDSL